METANVPHPSTPSAPEVLSPLEVILLEALSDAQFCQRDHYVAGVCETCGCFVCRDLMLGQEGGTA